MRRVEMKFAVEYDENGDGVPDLSDEDLRDTIVGSVELAMEMSTTRTKVRHSDLEVIETVVSSA